MNTPDVIQTISRATDELKTLLLQQEASINDQERANERLTSRVDNLEAMLSRTREDRDNLSQALTESNRQHQALKLNHKTLEDSFQHLKEMYANLSHDYYKIDDELEATSKARDTAEAELKRLRDIIINIGVAVEPIVNPPLESATNPTATADRDTGTSVVEPVASSSAEAEPRPYYSHQHDPSEPMRDEYGNVLPPGVTRDPVTGKWAPREEHVSAPKYEDQGKPQMTPVENPVITDERSAETMDSDVRPLKEAFGW